MRKTPDQTACPVPLRTLLLWACVLIAGGCAAPYSPEIMHALDLAGENAREIERVLEHFEREGDPQKREAAGFLITLDRIDDDDHPGVREVRRQIHTRCSEVDHLHLVGKFEPAFQNLDGVGSEAVVGAQDVADSENADGLRISHRKIMPEKAAFEKQIGWDSRI